MKSAAKKFIEDDLSPEKFEETRNSEGVSGSPENPGFSNMSDEEVIDGLTEIHGVGDWHSKLQSSLCVPRKLEEFSKLRRCS